MAEVWFLYLIECRGGSYYAGISTDVERRYAQHAAGRGARYTRAHPPIRLLGMRAFPDRSAASRAEHAIRTLPRSRKLAFLSEDAAETSIEAGRAQSREQFARQAHGVAGESAVTRRLSNQGSSR